MLVVKFLNSDMMNPVTIGYNVIKISNVVKVQANSWHKKLQTFTQFKAHIFNRVSQDGIAKQKTTNTNAGWNSEAD